VRNEKAIEAEAMPKWWWWWLPGWHRKWKLEKRRVEALSFIEGEKLAVGRMAQRPRSTDDLLDNLTLDVVRDSLAEVENRAKNATRTDDLDDLMDDAESQGQFRAYLCPRGEVWVEGSLAMALLQEWGVPKTVIDNLRRLVDQPLQRAKDDPEAARSALRATYEESDSWRDYTSDYEDEMKRLTRWWLFLPTAGMLLLAIVSLHFQLTVSLGMLLAGTAGSCVSVMAKMPLLEVSLSGELESYGRRILNRVGSGMIASWIGCGLLAWGVVSVKIQDQTFADVLNSCSAPCSTLWVTSCSASRTLILLAVPMLFGFSERALASFERPFFGGSKKSKKK
jgi:hypothetical protein